MTDDTFFDQAKQAIISVLDYNRPELLKHHGTVEFNLKPDSSVVTHLDKKIEEELRHALRKLDPGIGIEGEEFGVEGNRDTYWLIDPIDGTEQFVRGMPACKTQICLVDKGQAVWSLINYFVSQELYVAHLGHGATLNGHELRMRYRPLNRAWLDIGLHTVDPALLSVLKKLNDSVDSLMMMRDESLLYKGHIDGSVRFNAHGGGDWDYAPRSLFYSETGGKIANFGQDTYDFKNTSFIMCHKRNFADLSKIVSG